MAGGRQRLRAVGRLIRASEDKGAVRFVTGVTTAAPASGWVTVDIGSQVVKAKVPGSFRGNLAADQDVRLGVQGTQYTVDSVLSALSTPTVAAPPAASSVSPLDMTATPGFGAAGYSNAGFTSQDWNIINYVEQVILNDLNDHRDVLNNHDSAITSLRDTVNALRTTLDALRSALVSQGHVV